MPKKIAAPSTFDKIMDEYIDKRPIYEQFTTKARRLIVDLLDAKNFKIHSISARTKKIESLEEKLEREEKHYEKLSDITDLSGVRIICLFSDDVDKVAEIIAQNFKVNDELSIDKRENLDPDKFGYISLHYIVEISADRENLADFEKFKGLICEIQIRSILQHAWAEIEHDLGYKSISGIPKNIRRKFSRQAGILELADEQFITIRQDIEEYGKRIENLFKHSYDEILIDNITLKYYIELSDDIKQIQYKSSLIRKLPMTIGIDMDYLDAYVKICKFYNILTISELDKKIKENEINILDLTWFLENKTIPTSAQKRTYFAHKSAIDLDKNIEELVKSKKRVNTVRRGSAIWMLGYVLACQKTGLEYKQKYLKTMDLLSVPNLDTRLLDFCEKKGHKK